MQDSRVIFSRAPPNVSNGQMRTFHGDPVEKQMPRINQKLMPPVA
jgi:hypothetical protein